jgi:hypothetical protein
MTVWNPAPPLLPDIELVLNPWLSAQLLSVYGVTARVASETPENLESVVPFVRLYRVTGSDKAYPMILDQATISVDSFGADRASASQVGRQVHALLYSSAQGSAINGAAVGGVITIAGPRWLPYSDLNIRRYNATYAVTFRAA